MEKLEKNSQFHPLKNQSHFPQKTHYCGDISSELVGQTVVIMGWIDGRRDHGKLIFIDLRDREGLVQVVLDPSLPGMQSIKELGREFVVAIEGQVRLRPQGMGNAKVSTGSVEVEATQCTLINSAETPPFLLDQGDGSGGVSLPQTTEALRLRYRYLDLRSRSLQSNLRLRHRLLQLVRNFLSERGFIEVETPILYKPTPEGARDYLVPSRVNMGRFYALPQSPQTLKQLLMIGGLDRYFQIARCFRDEDLRADRQPEFSQIDMEMSFVGAEDVMELNERLAQDIWREIKGVELGPLPRMKYWEAMERFGSDKPDLRFGMEIVDLSSFCSQSGFRVFEDILKKREAGAQVSGGSGSLDRPPQPFGIRGLVVPREGVRLLSRSYLDKLTDLAKAQGVRGLIWIKSEPDAVSDASFGIHSSVSKFLSPEKLQEIFQGSGAKVGEALLLVADEFGASSTALSALRVHLGKELKLIDSSRDRLLWVTDFPLLEYDAKDKRWVARHHPFTDTVDHQKDTLLKGDGDFGSLLAKAYDLVCNGYELGGGSIRIHSSDIQRAMFQVLGLSPEECEKRFGFFLEALRYGTPPHGGMAWGVDRLTMILCGTDAIRDVMAFPKTAKAVCLMSDAPSEVDREQLMEVGVRLIE